MKKVFLGVLLIFMLGFQHMASAVTYPDVPAAYKHYEAIQFVSERMILTGYQDGTYHPNASLYRAEAAAVLCRAVDTVYFDTQSPFKDVEAKGHWAYEYIKRLVDTGIIEVDSSKMFYPDETLKYGDAVRWMVNAAGYKKLAVNAGGYPNGYRTVAKDKRLSDNLDNIGMDKEITRGEMAQLIYNYLKNQKQDGTVIASDASGNFVAPLILSLSAVGEGYSVYYTVNGEDPTKHGILYEKPIQLYVDTNIKAVARKNGNWGEVQEFFYTILSPYTLKDLAVYNENHQMQSAVPKDRAFIAEVTVTKNTDRKEKDNIILATYDEGGGFVGYTYMYGGITMGQTMTFGTMMYQTEGRNIKTIKAFVWDGFGTMIPMSNILKF